ncbi:fimbrial protein [Escherichia coli]|nr:fimbrial protein [Escherichia coli]EKM3552002.1 fimbrial protein [Escherichia coli]EKM3738902.1 fimbrial protein [Escherichia coli]EKM3833300.1 fimbrial protein [Escherichia coli]EKP8089340.1 fimbrial protein [Escherichia coli]
MKAFFLAGSAALLLACGVTVFPAMAGGKIVNLTLRVLVDGPPPCSIQGSAVEFGSVVIKGIDGTNYRQPVGYTMNCSNSVSDDLRMQLQATTTTINGETVLSTGIDGFGIRIQNATNHSLVAVGNSSWLPFKTSTQPDFEAVPVKQSGVELMASEFNATMTMVVDYQ